MFAGVVAWGIVAGPRTMAWNTEPLAPSVTGLRAHSATRSSMVTARTSAAQRKRARAAAWYSGQPGVPRRAKHAKPAAAPIDAQLHPIDASPCRIDARPAAISASRDATPTNEKRGPVRLGPPASSRETRALTRSLACDHIPVPQMTLMTS